VIRVARQSRVDAVEGLRRDGRTADVAEALEHDHTFAGEGEIGSGDESVVAAANDDSVVAV